jgi:hypothetical protein
MAAVGWYGVAVAGGELVEGFSAAARLKVR